MKNNENAGKEPSKKAVDPTDPRQAAFISGGITGAVAGAAVGSAAGPVGTVAGAVAGGLAGAKSAQDISIDIAAEDDYWKQNWKSRPYVTKDRSYADYAPAYRAGYNLPIEMYRDTDSSFMKSEPAVRKAYEEGDASMPWSEARPAAQDAFDRVMKARGERRDASRGAS